MNLWLQRYLHIFFVLSHKILSPKNKLCYGHFVNGRHISSATAEIVRVNVLTQNNGYYAVQRNSKPPLSVPVRMQLLISELNYINSSYLALFQVIAE